MHGTFFRKLLENQRTKGMGLLTKTIGGGFSGGGIHCLRRLKREGFSERFSRS